MSGVPWLRLDDDGAVIEKIDPYEAAGGPEPKGAPMTSPFESVSDVALAALEDLCQRLDDTDDAGALVDGWQQARTIADAAQSAVWHLAGRVGDALGSRHDRAKRRLPDGRTVEFSPGERRVWDRDREGACLEALRRAALLSDRKVDPETGEIEQPLDVVLRVLREAARFEWRTSVLRLYGLDADQYSDLKAGRPTVRIEKNS